MSAESRALRARVLQLEAASTEPHSCECGEELGFRETGGGELVLQRSRTRVSAERTELTEFLTELILCFNGAALV